MQKKPIINVTNFNGFLCHGAMAFNNKEMHSTGKLYTNIYPGST